MNRLGIAPKNDQLNSRYVTDWLKGVGDRLSVYSGTTDPTTSTVSSGEWQLFKNTTTGVVKLWTNDAGTMKSVALTTTLPAFSAYQSVAASLAAGVFTKVRLQSEEFDATNAFDSTVNYRFQPTTSGTYMLTGAVGVSASSELVASIYKNGSEFKRGQDGTTNFGSNVSALVQLNGSTDFVELWCYSSSLQNAVAGAIRTYFQGYYIGP